MFIRPRPVKVPVADAGTPTPSTVPLIWGFNDPKAPDYKIEFKKHADSTWTVFEHESLNYGNEIEVTGLDSATEYDFRISALNSYGASAPSDVVTASTTAE